VIPTLNPKNEKASTLTNLAPLARPMSKSVSQFIDAARWIAALAVLLQHTGPMINISDYNVGHHEPGVYVWWFLAEFGHQAVVVFFVISGFLVGGAVLQRLRGSTPFLRNYFIDRFSRIYIVFAPVLLYGFVLDSIGRRLFPNSVIYEHPSFEGVFAPVNMLTALLQQQQIWATQAGTNSALWSLACEMWYYIIFALILLPLSGAYSKTARLAACVCGMALLVVLSIPKGFFLFGLLVWTLGALIGLARAPLIASKWVSLAIFIVAEATIRFAVRSHTYLDHPILSYVVDAVTAASFANLLLTLRFSMDSGFSFCRWPIHRRLSDFSYSLYASHQPMALFVWAGAAYFLGNTWHTLLPTPLHWGVTFALVAITLVAGYCFSIVTEARTDTLRKFLRALFARIDQRTSTLETPAPRTGEHRLEGL